MNQYAHANFHWIDTEEAFSQHWGEIQNTPVLALDTESNSYHGYQSRICLLQLATPTAVFLLDPLTLSRSCLQQLAAVLEDPNVPKVMHGSDNDILGLQRDLSLRLCHLFDTMLAARFLNLPKRGLDSLLEEYFGVHTSKKYQRFPWKQRPIPPDALYYAAGDVAYLVPLYRELTEALQTRERLDAVWEDSHLIATRTYEAKPFDTQGFWKIKGANSLRAHEMALLQSLYLWRHEFCCATDTAAFRVLEDRKLLLLVQANPQTRPQLIHFLKQHRLSLFREADSLLLALEQGRQVPIPQRPPRSPRESSSSQPPIHEALLEDLRQWREQMAATEHLELDLVVTNQILQTLARQLPKTWDELFHIPGLTSWRIHRYGHTWIDLIKHTQRSS